MIKIRPILIIIGAVILIVGIALYFIIPKPQADIEKKEISAENNPFGFAGPTAPIDNFSKIQNLGVKYAREAVSWDKIEPSFSQYNFSAFNQSGQLDQYGLEIIARLKLGQIWATKCNLVLCSQSGLKDCPAKSADCPPKDLGSWTDKGYSPLTYDVVSKTLENVHSSGKKFQYLILGNEVNSWVFWQGTAQDYLKTRATVYKAVKDTNAKFSSDYKLIDNGIASTIWGGVILRENYCTNDQSKKNYAIDFTKRYFRRTYDGPYTETAFAKRVNCTSPSRDYLFLKEIFKKDPNLGEATFDIMSYHFYEPWDTQEEVINWIKAEMKKNGYEKPIANTEGGYRDTLHLYSNTSSLTQDVANEIPKLHVVAFTNGVKIWLWLPFTERGEGYQFYGLEWKGLISTDQKELPAYTSYKTMVQKLDGFKTIEKIADFSSPYIYKFTFNSKAPVYVLWSTKTETINFSSKIKGSVQITKANGETQRLKSSDLPVSESPIFVENE
jgi:hypothetical protein